MSSAGEQPEQAAGDTERFVALWEAHARRIHAYATRHVGADSAEVVVAETFLVAWRRLGDVPGDPLPWLLVVARNTIANAGRSAYRERTLLAELARLSRAAAPAASGPEPVTVERESLLRGLAGLTEREREALLLVAWDGLSPAQAASVAGCSTATFHVRLHRARRRLAHALDEPDDDPDADADHGAPTATRCEAVAHHEGPSGRTR